MGGCPAARENPGGADRKAQKVASFKFDQKAIDNLLKDTEKKLKKAEAEANKAAAGESTPEKKARAFAQVLRKHGVSDVDEKGPRKQFGG